MNNHSDASALDTRMHVNGIVPAVDQKVIYRVQELRDEIARIREENEAYLQTKRHVAHEIHDHQNRERRLQDILNELASLVGNRSIQ